MFRLAKNHLSLTRCCDVAVPLHDLGGGENRRQRIAQLVGQERQELVLSAIGFAQSGLGLLEPRDVDEGADRPARRAALIAQRHGTAVQVDGPPVLEPDHLFVVSHREPSRGSLQRQVLGPNRHVVHEHLEVPRRSRVGGGLREVLTRRAMKELVRSSIANHFLAFGVSSDQHCRWDGVHQRRELIGPCPFLGFSSLLSSLGREPLGRVCRDVDEARLAAEIDGCARKHECEHPPILGPTRDLDFDARTNRKRLAERLALSRRPHAECDGILSDSLAPREASKLRKRLVDAQVRSIGQPGNGCRLWVEVKDGFEPALGRAKRRLRLAAILHVEGRAEPARDHTLFVADRRHSSEVKAIGSFPVADPVLHFARGRGCDRLCKAPLDFFPIIGVDRDESALLCERLLLAQAGQLHPPIVHPLETPLGVGRPDDLRQGIGEFPIARSCARRGDRCLHRLTRDSFMDTRSPSATAPVDVPDRHGVDYGP